MSTRYEDEYHKWVASLPPKQRAKLAAQGLDKPFDDHGQTNTPANADVVFATMGDDFDYGQFDEAPALDENAVDEKAKAYGSLLLCWVFQRLQRNRTEKESALDRDALLFSLGLGSLLSFKTQTELALHYGVTRAAVSARVKSWQKITGVKPSPFMKTESACKAYRKARIRNLTKGNRT